MIWLFHDQRVYGAIAAMHTGRLIHRQRDDTAKQPKPSRNWLHSHPLTKW
jgi:hypothetical protein